MTKMPPTSRSQTGEAPTALLATANRRPHSSCSLSIASFLCRWVDVHFHTFFFPLAVFPWLFHTSWRTWHRALSSDLSRARPRQYVSNDDTPAFTMSASLLPSNHRALYKKNIEQN